MRGPLGGQNSGWPGNYAKSLPVSASFGGIGMIAIGFYLADKDSPYPFAPEEMQRFDCARRLARIRNAGTVMR